MLSWDERSNVVTVSPTAELDLATAASLRQAVVAACALQPKRVVVDCSGVTFSDTTAITALLHGVEHAQAQGCPLEIRNPDKFLIRLATLLGVADRLGL